MDSSGDLCFQADIGTPENSQKILSLPPFLSGCVTYQCWPLLFLFSIVAVALCEVNGGRNLVDVNKALTMCQPSMSA